MDFTNFNSIFASTSRIAFGRRDSLFLYGYLRDASGQGFDVQLDINDAEAYKEMLSEGAMLFSSIVLERRFLFVNVDAGKGFFGGQKTHILSFLGDLYRDEYLPGPSFKSLMFALTSINNIYRAIHRGEFT